ncbi:hypothetical protein AAC387_Pa08g1695 [Persea americana]
MWSPKPRRLKKNARQDTALASLEENTFYSLTQKEGRYGRRRLALIIVGPTLCPLKVHTKYPKKKQQHFSINNVAELAQFKDLLKKEEKNEVDILTLLVHQPEEMDHAINPSIPMLVRRSGQALATDLAN